MTQIDTSKWGGFRVGDLFEIKPTKSYKMRNADLLDGGNTPVVVNSAFNNGIGGFTTQEPTEKGGIITFSDTVDANTIFYQEKPFAGYSHVQGVYPVGEWANEWDKYSLLFFASCFKSTALRYGFDYSNKFRRDVALELKVLLPQTPDHTPDFDYMENYMKNLTKLAAKRVEKLKEEKTQTKIDTSNWKKFTIGELFECNIAKSLDFGKLEKGDIIFIGRTSTNNGVQGKVNALPCEKGNCITVSMVGDSRAFYQPQEFAASQNILVLRNKRLNEKNGLFFVTLINSLLAKYNYSNTVKKKKFINESILLPITPEGTPDFDYMENYMKDLETIAINMIKKLKEEKPQTKIDTSNWKKFKVGELFDVTNGKKYPSSIRQTGELPLISTTANNNGISDYIKDRNDGVYSNCITVAYSGSVGATFYHKEKVFVGETVIALLPKFKMNQYSGLFICSILSKINSKFSYTQKIKVLQYKNEAISLPVTPEGTPDFDYMENYMKEITEKAVKRVKKITGEKNKYKIDTKGWGKFRVGDLFEIKRSKNNIKFERCNTGSTPLISAVNENNGIIGYINKEDFEVFPANSITVNIFGKAFVQTKDFCASANVLIIRNEHLTKNIGLFIAAILSKKHSKYNYNDQINKDKLFNETIPLPVTSEGAPDFDYMENYMKNIEDCVNNIIEQAKKKI